MKRRCVRLAAAGSAVLVALWLLCHCELYCRLWPSIDTVYAKEYSEEAFLKLRVGMSVQDVNAIMCPPLTSAGSRDGETVYCYTRDGSCALWDFAWLARYVIFKDGRVVEVVSTVYYD